MLLPLRMHVNIVYNYNVDNERFDKRRSVLLIPYYKENDEVYVFLQKRSANAERLPGMFGLFGGGLESNESPEQGLVWEIQEELSVAISTFSFFNHYEFYGRIDEVYVAQVDKAFHHTVHVNEGDYGCYFTETSLDAEQNIILPDRIILNNFFGLLKRNDPYS